MRISKSAKPKSHAKTRNAGGITAPVCGGTIKDPSYRSGKGSGPKVSNAMKPAPGLPRGRMAGYGGKTGLKISRQGGTDGNTGSY